MSLEPTNGHNQKSRAKTVLQELPSPYIPLEKTGIAAMICPHLGLADDPDTKMLFASPAACCHHVTKPSYIDLEHQQAFCLGELHSNCPVYQQEELKNDLPTGIAGYTPGNPRKRLYVGLLVLLIIASIAGTMIWGINQNTAAAASNDGGTTGITNPTIQAAEPAEQPAVAAMVDPTATATVTPLPSATPLPTATATDLPPTATPQPTNTPIPPTTVPTATSEPKAMGATNIPNLNVRSGPSIDYLPLTVLSETNVALEITGRNEIGDWVQVCCVEGETESGWVFTANLDLSEAVNLEMLPLVPNPLPQVEITVSRLNVRRGPGTEYDVLAIAEEASTYTVSGQLIDGSWWQVCCIDGETGWVFSESVRLLGLPDTVPFANVPPVEETN